MSGLDRPPRRPAAAAAPPPALPLARRMWLRTEPIHAVVYFAPEHRQAQDALGLRGGWMAYFASRAAPLGPVPSAVVAALFHGFSPAMVGRALPDAWGYASPDQVLGARYQAVGRALERLLGERGERARIAAALEVLRSAVAGCDIAGRPMFAANQALAWPDAPLPALWHATTLLRELRGDGHVAALVAHGIDGCEAHLLAAASGRGDTEQLRVHRGWSTEEWASATGRLQARGLLAGDGGLTEGGRRLHEAVEDLTDRLAAPVWERLPDRDLARLDDALDPLLHAIDAAGELPYPNPMGLPRVPAAGLTRRDRGDVPSP